MKGNFKVWLGLVLSSLLLFNCGVTQSKYQKEYNKVWKEMIQSQAWQESLKKTKQVEEIPLYATTDEGIIIAEEGSSYIGEANFEKQFHSLVSRAYFKIITEAEKADVHISTEYKFLTEQAGDDQTANKSLRTRTEEIAKKYEAHKAMLGGLKSWNIFSENRSGDLTYFKAETREEIQKMIHNGEANDKMINFLIYKLADLYHGEE